uniref:Cytochrome c oxidase subunit 3 n=1 Tax=Trichinella papuae TaxID=268474 RepID=A0A0A0V0N6_9BILA|nr:cytochrome c oxidase subunit III [Trichinella papuae]AIW57029.1 cytochrome c oxidase subunit III [Trichinella papuae]
MNKSMNFTTPWPMLTSMTILSTCLSLITSMNYAENNTTNPSWLGLKLSIIMMTLTLYYWGRDSMRDSTTGAYTNNISSNTKLAMILFLTTEAFFFVTFFWMFLSSALIPEQGMWPPTSLNTPSPFGVPSLNTILLVTSSATVTMSHFQTSLPNGKPLNWLLLTLTLSILFITVQYLEYYSSTFTMSSGVNGSIFFMTTGFHGLHVLLGSTALMTCLLFMNQHKYSNTSLNSYEMSIWYWHFVDAVWLMLYTIFYCWGS